MNSNKLIIFGVAAGIVFLSIIYFTTEVDSGEGKISQHSPLSAPKTVESIAGDTTADSYEALRETLQKGQDENEEIKKENRDLKNQTSFLQDALRKVNARLDNLSKSVASTSSKNSDIETADSLITTKSSKAERKDTHKQRLNEKVKEYRSKRNGKSMDSDSSKFELSNGFEFTEGLGFSKFGNKPSKRTYDKNDPNKGWMVPLEMEGDILSASKSVGAIAKSKQNKKSKPANHPAMTISDNAVLYDAKALTYLVGRIPVGGRVADPYPVKIIVGGETLIANGFDLPGIEGMFFSGYAVGDMTMGCVRAEMNSYTFVFNDGRKVSFREQPRTGKGNKEPMAYISDRFGLPCVVGEFVSNVAEFLSVQSTLSALSAAGQAYAAAETTTSTTGLGGGTSAVTGDQGKFAMGKVVSGSVEDIRKWYLDRQSNSFDAVVVRSGTEVSIHVNRDIILDYDEAARKIEYKFNIGRVSTLD